MELELISKENVIDNIWTFRFGPSEPIDWVAGQYAEVELPHDNADDGGTKRFFTNAAAPYEGVYQITTRISQSSFKQALRGLIVGDKSLKLMSGPSGDFVWQDSDMPIVFVAGGIGITPFHSIIKQHVHEGQSIPLSFVYGSRTADVAFRSKLDEWATSSALRVNYVVGERVDANKLATLIPNLNASLVYVSGPEPMVEVLGDDLKANGLPASQLKQDFFPYYDETNY